MLVRTFIRGDWKTRMTYLIMGFGSLCRGQWLRGLLFLLFQAVFVVYMALFGWKYVSLLPSLGQAETTRINRLTVYGDNSFLIMLYGVLTLFFMLAYAYTWWQSIRQSAISQEILTRGGHLPSAREDLRSLADEQFHKSLLALPVAGVVLFTVLPIVFMVLVAFTNYDHAHQPPGKLFTWVGVENFASLLTQEASPVTFTITSETEEIATLALTAKNGDVLTAATSDLAAARAAQAMACTDFAVEEAGEGRWTLRLLGEDEITLNVTGLTLVEIPSYAHTFRQVLLWTLIWAVFATVLNYFLGMLVAMLINKRGVRLKKLWRTLLVTTIAVPQFVSLLYVSRLFASDGLINGLLMDWGLIDAPLPFWTDAAWARATIIGVNVWIGVPYMMLIATGILMNIPADLYEAARMDGANAFQAYWHITLPYMLFITGPYLLTSFTGNINNFNVIFLLSQGKPMSLRLAGNAGSTDLLITWLYKMTVTDSNFKLAAVMGVAVFAVCALVNLGVYNLIPSIRHEEDMPW